MNDRAKRAVDLSAKRRRLLEALLQEEHVESAPIERIPLRKEAGPLPLSFAQQRLWFLDQWEPGSPVYNIPAAFRLRGPLRMAALEQSVNEIVRRHEILRTTFAVQDSRPVQVIAPDLTVALPVLGLQSLPATEREAEVRRLATEEAQRPFNLAQGPLLRIAALRLGEQEHVLLLTMHHIISDGWSHGIFLSEIAALYKAFSEGKPSPLPLLLIQYADFALWQRQWLSGPRLQDQLVYWKRQLTGPLPVLEWPADRPRPKLQSSRGATQPLRVPARLSRTLQALARQEGATLFMVLLAAFQAWLHRYSGQTDLLVGTPVANRTRLETEGLIGFFVNTLVLRTDLTGDPSFRALVRRVREVALEAYAHQDLPFEQLVEALQPERALSHTPLFQAMFILQNAPLPSLEPAGLTVSTVEVDAQTAKFDLMLAMQEIGEELSGSLSYSTDLFDPATITRMLGHFQTLLEDLAANPDKRLSALALLTEAERRQLLVEWQDTRKDYPQDLCIHQLFEAQAERTPQAAAAVFAKESLTYGELNRRANQLAHHLRALGVGPEIRVGLCMERSLEMLVGLLGILKAGGAYVPLDPTYPKERLALMLEDAQVAVLLTQPALLPALPEYKGPVLGLDTDWARIARQRVENPVRAAGPDNLAYVIYTSGSTGRPKGVAMPHRPLSNMIAWQCQSARRSGGARTLQFTSLNFDVSFQEIFATWCSGGTLVLIAEDVRRDARALWRLLTEEAVERLFLPFVALQQLAEVAESQVAAPTTLREVITAGEALQITRPIRSLFKKLNGGSLHNQYGPSESHIVTAFPLTGSPDDWPALPPIGRPIANTRIYLLDDHQQPVPIGVPGELYIGGVGLARGYLNQCEWTAERFLPDPFNDEPGARLYKTGDRARYRPDGQIEFLGRIDHQVKIRGYRVELEEIEAALGQHPAVREAVVLVREEESGNKYLVAYLVTQSDSPPSVRELRHRLKEQLPEYMVPSAYMFLDALPLLPNGKIDRRALPAPAPIRTGLGTPFLAPRTPVEQTLAGIWTQVLGAERVGLDDNFFELGGHSLMATQIISRVQEAFAVELPLRRLFEAPTVAELAVVVAQAIAEQADGEALASMMSQVEQLSDDEVQRLLDTETPLIEEGDQP